jgi:hypothetical protein
MRGMPEPDSTVIRKITTTEVTVVEVVISAVFMSVSSLAVAVAFQAMRGACRPGKGRPDGAIPLLRSRHGYGCSVTA